VRKSAVVLFILLLSVVVLSACQKEEAVQPADTVAESAEDAFDRFGSGELGQLNTLALGTLLLEESGDPVSPSQAADLIPLWQVLQSETLKSQAETDAVLKQIEGKMTASQLNTIAGMELTREDMVAWMEAQGVEIGGFGEDAGGGRGGGFGQMGDMTEEERAQMREQMQALRDLSPEERQERMAEMGFEIPEGAGEGMADGGFVAGARGGNFLLTPLLDYLTERAAE
jgi:hypothetical protein